MDVSAANTRRDVAPCTFRDSRNDTPAAPSAQARLGRSARIQRPLITAAIVQSAVNATIPADVAIHEHPDFVAGIHSTKWVEDVLDLTAVGASATVADGEAEAKVQRDVEVEVNGKRSAVKVFVPESQDGAVVASGPAPAAESSLPLSRWRSKPKPKSRT